MSMEPTPDPAVSDTTMGWEQLEQLISDHLFGAVRDNQTVWCDAPGTRYVQYSCIGEDGFDAEAVGPEFIEAGPTSTRVNGPRHWLCWASANPNRTSCAAT